MSKISYSTGVPVFIRRYFATLSVMLIIVMMSAPAVVANSVYRLEDRGLVTYQDRVPDSDQDNGHSILNNQGVVLEEVLSRKERLSAHKLERERQQRRIRDRTLLATYSSEEDLVRTRDDRIGLIDRSIQRLDDRIRILSERLNIVNERIDSQEGKLGAQNAAETLYAERQSAWRNIENAWSLIDAKVAERQETTNKFEADLTRYRELKSDRP